MQRVVHYCGLLSHAEKESAKWRYVRQYSMNAIYMVNLQFTKHGKKYEKE